MRAEGRTMERQRTVRRQIASICLTKRNGATNLDLIFSKQPNPFLAKPPNTDRRDVFQGFGLQRKVLGGIFGVFQFPN